MLHRSRCDPNSVFLGKTTQTSLNPGLIAAPCSALAVHHSQKLHLLLQHFLLLLQQFLGVGEGSHFQKELPCLGTGQFAQLRVGMQNLCPLGFSHGVVCSKCLHVPLKCCREFSLPPVEVAKLLKCFGSREWHWGGGCKADLFDVSVHRNSPQTLHILWASSAAALGGCWQWDYFICPK